MAVMRPNMMRLHRDITELEREPLEGIRYHMYEGDMTHMCLILSPTSGPFRRLRLHLDVKIPVLYPQHPPMVSIQTSVTHPNVFGTMICCDILREGDRGLSDGSDSFYNGGYTPAYLLKYVFLQLLSFFSAYEVDQDYGGPSSVLSGSYRMQETDEISFRESMWKVVKAFRCTECGFNITFQSSITRWSSIADDSEQRHIKLEAEDEDMLDSDEMLLEVRDVSTMCPLEKLTDDCWLLILDRLSDQDMYTLSNACSQVKEVVKNHRLVIRRQLVCFYLRKTFREAVLGIGIYVPDKASSRAPYSGGVPAPTPATIRVLDLFSYEAFKEHGVRSGIYGEKFNVFLPVALDGHHFVRAELIIREALQHLHRVFVRPDKFIHGQLCIVEVLPRLINGMVLDLVKDFDENSGSTTVFQQRGRNSHLPPPYSTLRRRAVKKASEKALQGYCLLLHLFSKLAKRYPAVETELRRRVKIFRESAFGRHKDSTPNIGEFLTYLFVLKEDWQTCCVPFIEELLARNVVWFLDGRNSKKKYPHLAHIEDNTYVSLQRLSETFEGSLQSLRLVMFQVSFLRLAQSESEGVNSQYGYPSVEKSEALLHQTRRIYDVKDWDSCMGILGFEIPADNWRPKMCKMLKSAVKQSQMAKYHVVPYSPHQLYYMRVCAESTCPPPSWWKPCDPFTYNLVGFERRLSLSFFPKPKR